MKETSKYITVGLGVAVAITGVSLIAPEGYQCETDSFAFETIGQYEVQYDVNLGERSVSYSDTFDITEPLTMNLKVEQVQERHIAALFIGEDLLLSETVQSVTDDRTEGVVSTQLCVREIK